MAGSKDSLKSFKAQDAQKKPLPRNPKPSKQETVAAPSAGFPTIEHLLEQDSLDVAALGLRLDALNKLAADGGAKEKGAVRKAIAAYELTKDLLEYLWQTKQNLAANMAKAK